MLVKSEYCTCVTRQWQRNIIMPKSSYKGNVAEESYHAEIDMSIVIKT